jgi:hypothetical protein
MGGGVAVLLVMGLQFASRVAFSALFWLGWYSVWTYRAISASRQHTVTGCVLFTHTMPGLSAFNPVLCMCGRGGCAQEASVGHVLRAGCGVGLGITPVVACF